MALLGISGSAEPGVIQGMRDRLRHRGAVSVGPNLGGEYYCSDGQLSMAWSGTIRVDIKREQLPSFLIRSYRESGIEFTHDLSGEFVLAIRDHERLFLVRDPVGARTAFCGRHAGRWYLAAEPKAIWGLPGFSRRIRAGAIAQYFTYSFIPGAATMLEQIWEMLPGHWVELGDEPAPNFVRYFQFPNVPPATEEQVEESLAESAQQFKRLLAEEVAKRIDLETPPVVFLSGGLDSSAVTAEVASQFSGRVRTFSVHFGKKYPNELAYAKQVSTKFNTEHEEIEIKPSVAVERLREMVWHLDEPIGDPVTLPNFELASRVSQLGVRSVFNGEGGDPLFGGPKNMAMLLGHWYGGIDHAFGFRERRYLESYKRGYTELSHVLTPVALQGFDESLHLHGPLRPFFDQPGPLLHKLLGINTQLKGAHLILPKIERMLAASNVTPLSPMFTKSMVELAFSTVPRAKLNRGVEKWLIKEACRGLVPDDIIDRPKSGMRVPVHFWMKGPLRKFARSILSRRALKEVGLFDPDRVQQWLKYDIEQPNGRYGLRIWMLLTFEIWRRIVIEGESV
ncbi:MAG: asparagine synthase (glutamine-hydrolyzing) [Mariniblastus sp.]|jgi:asparagine synthase (glutamine-hydrolysing)